MMSTQLDITDIAVSWWLMCSRHWPCTHHNPFQIRNTSVICFPSFPVTSPLSAIKKKVKNAQKYLSKYTTDTHLSFHMPRNLLSYLGEEELSNRGLSVLASLFKIALWLLSEYTKIFFLWIFLKFWHIKNSIELQLTAKTQTRCKLYLISFSFLQWI